MKNITETIKKQQDKLYIGLMLVLAWFGVYGITYLSTLFTANYFSNGIISLFVYAVVFVMLQHTAKNISELKDKKSRRKRILYAFGVAFLFAVVMVMGYQLRMTMMTESGFRGKVWIVLRSLALSICVFPFTNYLFMGIEKLQNISPVQSAKTWKSRNVFLSTMAAVFVCWIPVFLAYYPAVMAYDFHRQSIEAAKGFVWFNSYQPLAHTWLIWVAFQIGKVFGSYEIGMAFYSIFQMLVFAVACGYSCVTVYRLVKKKWPVVAMVLFYGLFPFISVLSVGATKDVLFSALFLVFISLFVERTFLCDEHKQKVMDILWVLEGIVMMLFRNNAIYAVAVFMFVYLILGAKKQRLRILIVCLLLVIGGKVGLEGMQIVIGTEGRGSKVEMWSVPLQTMARVGYYHGDEMDPETFALLDKYVPQEFWQRYNPALSDPVKSYVGVFVYNDTWAPSISQMLIDWVKIGLKYPNEYLDAFLILNSGYWFWDDVTWAEVFGSGLEGRMGALSTYTSSTSEEIPQGIAHVSKFPALESALEELVSANCFYDWTVISNFFKPCFYCWALLLTVIASFYMKHKKKILVTMLPLVYLMTMFLGPVVQVRYVLPIIVIIPLMLGVLACQNDADDMKAEEK